MDKINLQEFESKVKVRNLTIDDFDALVRMQKISFPSMQPWSRENIENQLRIFPEGQIIIEIDDMVVASSSSFIIDSEDLDYEMTWDEICDYGNIGTHDPEGDTLYGMEIMVHPQYRGMKLATRMYEARKELAREHNLQRIVIGGRLPGYKNYRNTLNINQYVDKVTSKAIFDPVLTPQLSNGFSLKKVIKEYIDEDKESGGFATYLEWTNFDFQQQKNQKLFTALPVRICLVQYQMRTIRSFDDFAIQCEYFVDVASGYKSDFIMFPEIFTLQLLTIFPKENPGTAARKIGEFTEQYLELFSELAIKYNINIIAGSHFTPEGDKLYNIAYLFKRSGEIGKQYKLHISPNEKKWWGVEPGRKIEVFDTDKGKIAIQVCYDIEFPEVSRIAVERGARIIFVPFCTDDRQSYLRVKYCAQARCVENQIFVAIAGTVGNLPHVDNMDIQYAQSGIFTPSDFSFARDAIAAESTPNVETVIVNDIDLELLKRHRNRGTVTNWNDRRNDLYRIQAFDMDNEEGEISEL
ncbi:MAG: GNAT family N-acetyltransferase [Bacteroidetes bacterium]|nr:MAG: GNAT family N-acetyltransferase [Bacteroidota bacterium]